MLKDRNGRMHDALGRFARTGAMKRTRVPHHNLGGGANITAFHARSAAERRQDKLDITEAARKHGAGSYAVRSNRRGARQAIGHDLRRTEVTVNPRTGKKQAMRGTREIEVTSPTRPGVMITKTASRVVRTGKAAQKMRAATIKPTAKAPPKPNVDPRHFPAMTDAALRDVAKSMGIELPKRAGRNQIIELIRGGAR